MIPLILDYINHQQYYYGHNSFASRASSDRKNTGIGKMQPTNTNTQGIKFHVEEEEAIKLLFTLLLPQRCKELHSHQTLPEKMQQTSPEKKTPFQQGLATGACCEYL